ncbi:MAG TPA: TraR/DksA C4-type zinc finger protein [Gammaproteobacteria bacterium]|nr:TraR/DksA C4-type zinc finger protein [Gammaproteobacteria bacterium]
MTEHKDFAELENTLRERREALRGNIERHLMEAEEDQYRDIAHRVRDAGEASVYDLIKGLEFERIETESRELEAVEHALIKFDNSQYGLCEDCGRRIQLERLRAEPTAMRCITCQEKREIEFGGGERGTATL